MRKHLLTILASAALALGVAGQASADGRDYHGSHRGENGHRYNGGNHLDHRSHHDHNRPYYTSYSRHARPYYSGNYYAPPPPPIYHDRYDYDYGASYSQPGFGIYIGR